MSDQATATVSPVRAEGFWDGLEHAYIPPAERRIPASLRLHEEAEVVTDPITFEVIRHNLWNINQEHSSTIENLSVSTIMLESRDYQTAICTESGEILFFGLGVQYFAGWMDYVIAYVMEHHGEDIAEGDMWMVNDPWIGTAHQPDVNLLCPVFVDGRLFCWVVNAAHMNDVGGTVPGSFCPNAQDVYFDPPIFPPCRIVQDGKINSEIEGIYRRQSRTPVNLALDLRATIAGNHAARERMLALVEKYGAATVKGVMRGLLDSTQESFKQMLAKIPDGTWSERLYQEVAVTGDRGVYRIELQMRKQGDVLTFSNEGTDPQVGAINLPFAGWRGGVMAVLNVVMLADHMGVVGGAARQLRFDPQPGTLTCPDYGVAVSPAGIYATEVGVSMANSVISKMLMCAEDPTLRARALTPTNAQWQIHIHAGVNQRGTYYVGPMLDGMIGMTGATPYRDGEFATGSFYAPEGRGPNVESYERDWPMLYLYRRRDIDSGGTGRFRGGVGGRLAYIPYNGEMGLGVYTAEGVPKTLGVMGGGPGPAGQTKLRRDSRTFAAFAAGELPGSLEQVGGEHVQVFGKGDALVVEDNDVLEWNWSGSGGYGDPLTRAAAAVLADLRSGVISERAALDDYGVVLADGEVDEQATLELRRKLRGERLARSGSPAEVPLELGCEIPAGAVSIGEELWVDRDDGTYRCAHCGAVTGTLEEHAKSRLAVHEGAVTDISPLFEDPAIYVDDPVLWRELYCTGCGVRLSTEVARPGDPPVAEFRLEL
jgi:N-methylhydantoinase B